MGRPARREGVGTLLYMYRLYRLVYSSQHAPHQASLKVPCSLSRAKIFIHYRIDKTGDKLLACSTAYGRR